MIYSKACEYAIRALAYLAQPGAKPHAQAREIARSEHLPLPVLGKILQDLVRKGLLASKKGPGGGFRLARRANLITLRDVVAAMDGLDHFHNCAAGLPMCGDEAPCPLHDSWKVIRTQILSDLEVTTVAQMAAAVIRKKERAKRLARRR